MFPALGRGGSGHLAGGLRVKWEWGFDGQVTKAGEDLPTEVEEADWEMGLGCRPARMWERKREHQEAIGPPPNPAPSPQESIF